LIIPFFWAMKTRPSEANRMFVGSLSPDQTVVSVKPDGSVVAVAALALLAADCAPPTATRTTAAVVPAAAETTAHRALRIRVVPPRAE
jgi:hypothetical protein